MVKRAYLDLMKMVEDEGENIIVFADTLGTQQALSQMGILMEENLALNFWCDDADELGQFDPLFFRGIILWHDVYKRFIAKIDKRSIVYKSSMNEDFLLFPIRD